MTEWYGCGPCCFGIPLKRVTSISACDIDCGRQWEWACAVERGAGFPQRGQ